MFDYEVEREISRMPSFYGYPLCFHSLPRKPARSSVALFDDGFDQRALLRWADDGGRWTDQTQGTLQRVRI